MNFFFSWERLRYSYSKTIFQSSCIGFPQGVGTGRPVLLHQPWVKFPAHSRYLAAWIHLTAALGSVTESGERLEPRTWPAKCPLKRFMCENSTVIIIWSCSPPWPCFESRSVLMRSVEQQRCKRGMFILLYRISVGWDRSAFQPFL